jgi:hypothetical protein
MGDDRRCGRRKEKESCGGLVCGGRGGRLREGRPGVWLVRKREKSDEEGGRRLLPKMEKKVMVLGLGFLYFFFCCQNCPPFLV